MNRFLLTVATLCMVTIIFFAGCENKKSADKAKPAAEHNENDGHDHSTHSKDDGHGH